jgi:uncharacterized protein (TIGR02145 family)
MTGSSAQDKQSLTVAKGSCTPFTLSTKTTTSDQYGYTLSAYTSGTSGSAMPSGITIKKSDQSTAISTTAASPTEVIKTTAANTTLDNTSTSYYACADSGVIDGTYDVNFAYNIKENVQTILAGAMQSATTQQCANMTTFTGTNTGALAHLIDTRNGYYYWVGKLADGKCWMLENLQLGAGTYNQTTNDTDLPAGTSVTLPAATTSGYFGGSSSAAYTTMGWADPGSNDPTTYHASSSTLNNSNTTDYGYLYNWCAAMGGQSTACTASGTMPTATSGDICPKGWHMPTGNSTGELAVLNGYMNGGTTANTGNYYQNWLAGSNGPFRGVFAGHFYSGLSNQGSNGGVWSSSFYPSSSNYAFDAYFNSSYVYPGNGNGYRYDGFAVRCAFD